MICPNCGKQVSDNSKFCGFCGAVMTPPAAPVAEQSAETPVAAPVEPTPVAEQPIEAPVAMPAAPTEPVPVVEQPVAAPVAMPAVSAEPAPVAEQPMAEPVAMPAAPVQQPEASGYQQPVAQMQQQPMYQQPMTPPAQQPMAPPMQQPMTPPMQPQGNVPPFSPVPPVEKKKKKGKAGLVAVIIVLILALAGGGVFVFMRMNRPAKKIAAAFAENDIDTVIELYEKVNGKELDEVVTQAHEYAEKLAEGYLDGTGEQDYKTVSDTLDKLSDSVLKGDSELSDWIDTVEIVNDSRSAFKKAEAYKESGSYVEALDEYANVAKEDELNYDAAQQAITETQNLYREAVIKEAKSCEESGDFAGARNAYEEALLVLENDAQILGAIDDLEAAAVEQALLQAVEEAERAADEGRYSDAINIINDALEIQGLSSAQEQALDEKLSEITSTMYADGTILGTWKMECDFSEAVMSSADLGEDFADFEAPLVINIMFDFNEDGTYRLYVDEDSFRESFNGWVDALLAYTADVMYDMFEDMGLSRSEADEMIEEVYGMTLEEYIKEMAIEEGMVEEMLESMDMRGVYRTEDDRLYMGEEEINEYQYDLFHFEENKLIIEMTEEVEDAELFPGISYPFELIRVQ